MTVLYIVLGFLGYLFIAALGYRIVEDDEELKALNSCIKGIIQSERQKKRSLNKEN